MTHASVDEVQAHPGRWNVESRDLVAGAVVAAFGALLLVSALSIESPQTNAKDLGPRAFPIAIAALMTVGGVGLVLTAVFSRRKPAPEPAPPEGDDHHLSADLRYVGDEMDHLVDEVHDLMEEPPVSALRVLAVLGMFVAYLFLFVPLGFMVSTALFMFGVTTFVNPEKVLRNALVGVGIAVVVYLSFTELLTVELPAGILG